MTEISRLLDQLESAFNGDAWSGPSLTATLENVSACQAAAQPLAGAHSIWELVLHLAAWQDLVALRIVTNENLDMTPEANWPQLPQPVTDAAWQSALASLHDSHSRLLTVASSLSDADLNRVIGAADDSVGEGPSVYVQLHGVAQHNLYHAGQIMLLRKALDVVG
jgi:uncharacterized damage-inducible protein DinB